MNVSLNICNFCRMEGRRIAYYRSDILSDQFFWDEHWSVFNSGSLETFYQPYLNGYLGHGVLADVFIKYLPKQGRILEAGCGLSQHVIALRSRGYDCSGIDFADKTMERVVGLFPQLPVRKGDILQLPYENGSLDAYISLGVVEHFRNGPVPAIHEAARTLKRNGVMIISVPQVFNWRELSASPQAAPIPEKFAFYQYAFPPEEFREVLRGEGFAVLAEYGYESHYALRQRFSWFKAMIGAVPRLTVMDLLIDRTFLGRRLGRMRLYVAVKL